MIESRLGLGENSFVPVTPVSLVSPAGPSSFLTSIQSALTPLCALGGSTVIPGCTTLLTGNQTCSAPISISLPDTFNVSRCLNQTLLLCQNGSQATCLLTSVITTNPGTSINGLVCLVARLLDPVPGINLFTGFLRFLFNWCINITLPGILNLGQCLITPLTTTSIAGLLTALTDIITIVLRTSGLSFLLPFLQGALTPLCVLGGSTVIPGCTTLLTRNQTCAAPISISLPDTLNVSRCVNQTLLLCQNGTLATDRLLMNVFNTVTCLLTSVLTTNPGTTINGLVCLVLGLLQTIPFVGFFTIFVRAAFGCP
ncbi:hypothetical protein MTO96_004607 [Rhipicephalus appendiculatus]